MGSDDVPYVGQVHSLPSVLGRLSLLTLSSYHHISLLLRMLSDVADIDASQC